MKELLEALEDAPNVESIKYDNDLRIWTIEFHEGKKVQTEPEDLIVVLKNI